MSFKIARFFYFIIYLVLGIFFIVLGALGMALPWSPMLRTEIVTFILESHYLFILFGLSLLLIGFSLIIHAIMNQRHRYLSIRTGKRAVDVDENLIHHYLETYWQELFPKHPIPSSFKIKRNSIQIVAQFPYLPQSEQQDFLKTIQADFAHIFGYLLGYPHEVLLNASFQSTKK